MKGNRFFEVENANADSSVICVTKKCLPARLSMLHRQHTGCTRAMATEHQEFEQTQGKKDNGIISGIVNVIFILDV